MLGKRGCHGGVEGRGPPSGAARIGPPDSGAGCSMLPFFVATSALLQLHAVTAHWILSNSLREVTVLLLPGEHSPQQI